MPKAVIAGFLTSACAASSRVVDGDTLEIGTQVIRIHGIHAPEASQVCQLPKSTWDCSSAAVNVLRAMIEGKEVRCAGAESPWQIKQS